MRLLSLLCSCRVLQQLSAGVTSLSVMSAAVVHHLSSITSLGAQLATQLEQLLGWAGRRQRQQQLAAQQALGEQSGQMGVAVLLVGLGVAAVKVGRLWEVHQVGTAGSCMAGQHSSVCVCVGGGGGTLIISGNHALQTVRWQRAAFRC